MRKFVFLVLFLCVAKIGAQDQEITLNFPEITPPSPTAFEMTRYGDVSVNESTGEIHPSIPIHTFSVGEISIPINLSYNGNGVKVDQAASWTGINWSLNAGGVVTRMVRDLPDESANIRKFYSESELYQKLEGTDNEIESVRRLIDADNIDTEADIFSFNFSGYSGSFYLDENLEPKLTKYDKELKIEFFDTSIYANEIVITTPNGIRYYFGGDNASESSKSTTDTQGGRVAIQAQTAFYLNKVVHPNGDEVLLEYEDVGIYTIQVGTSEILREEDSPFANGGFSQSPQPRKHFNQVFGGKFLKKISSQNGVAPYVEFTTQDPSGFSRQHFTKILKEIHIGENYSPSILKKIRLDYIFPKAFDNSERFFLEKVIFNDGSGTQKQYEYSLEYDRLEQLPERFSFGQDHLGYANGKRNTTLLPRYVRLIFAKHDNRLADREPDFDFSSIGTLQRINYPTKGSTDFVYEPGKAFVIDYRQQTVSMSVWHNDDFSNPRNSLNSRVTIGEGNYPSPAFAQTISVAISAKASEDVTKNFAKVILNDLTTGEEIVKDVRIDLDNVTSSFTSIGNLLFDIMPDHKYELSLELDLHPTSINASIAANMSTSYYTPITDFSNGLGIRIQKTIDKTQNAPDKITRFYYSKIEDVLDKKDSGISLFPATYAYFKFIETENGIDGVGVWDLSSSSLTSIFLNDSNKNLYKYVSVSYGGDEFENGGKQSLYIVNEDNFPEAIILNPSANKFISGEFSSQINSRNNNSAVNGALESELLVKNIDGVLYKQKETINRYTINRSEYIENLKAQRFYQSTTPFTRIIRDSYLGIYSTYSTRFSIEAQSIKQFNSLVAIDTPDTESDDIFQTTTTFDYQGPQGIATQTKTIDSEEKLLLSKVVLPDMVNELSNLDQAQKDVITLLNKDNQHQIAIPIQTQVFEDLNNDGVLQSKELMTTNRIVFKDWGDNFIKSELIQSGKKFDALENRLYYYDYDNRGNPLEVSKSDGSHICYLWGYNKSYPIAKIENSTYAEIAAVLNVSVEQLRNFDESDMQKINSLRALITTAQTTTFTYDPLVGITSQTDPSGYTMTYHYDQFQRLKFVKDEDDKILSENRYHYKNN